MELNQAKTVAVIGAMEQEIELLKNDMQHLEVKTFGHFKIYHGTYHNKNMVLALSGIGKVNAAVATTLVINQFQPDFIINTGSAGGLGKELHIGDVVIGKTVAHHDVDVTAFGYAFGQVPQLPETFGSNDQLIELASQAATVFEGAKVHQGLIVSGDQFIHSRDKIDEIRQHFQNVQVVEMEAAAIAQVATQLQIPFVIIRAVSDLADEKADISFDEFLKIASVNSARMVQSLIKTLS